MTADIRINEGVRLIQTCVLRRASIVDLHIDVLRGIILKGNSYVKFTRQNQN